MKIYIQSLFKIKIIKFAAVGGISTTIHSLVYLFFIINLNVQPQFANIIGFIFALLFSYLGQRNLTFREVKVYKELQTQIKFLCSSLFSYGLNCYWVYLGEKNYDLFPHYELTGIILLTPLMTFFILRLWVFRNEK